MTYFTMYIRIVIPRSMFTKSELCQIAFFSFTGHVNRPIVQQVGARVRSPGPVILLLYARSQNAKRTLVSRELK